MVLIFRHIWQNKKSISVRLMLLFGLLCSSIILAKSDDVYIIYYATYNGKSGHVGIAVDNYKIRIIENVDKNNQIVSVQDSIKDGTLTYFDLWPTNDDFDLSNISKNQPAKYYKLPTASWEDDITVNSLLEKGIPNEENYPVDGLLKIKTLASKDFKLKQLMSRIIQANKAFNAINFNCTDFVELGLKFLLKKSFNSKEKVVLFSVSTPNKFYNNLIKLPEIIIIKDAKTKSEGSFLVEKILNNTIIIKTIKHGNKSINQKV
jgi:hypothetical protein